MIYISDNIKNYFRGRRDIDPNIILSILDYNKNYIETVFNSSFYYNLHKKMPDTYNNYGHSLRLCIRSFNQCLNQSAFYLFPDFFQSFLSTSYLKMVNLKIKMPSSRYRNNGLHSMTENTELTWHQFKRGELPLPHIWEDEPVSYTHQIMDTLPEFDAHLESISRNITSNDANTKLTPEENENKAYANRIGL
jgi:hypothetical protein